MFWIIIGVIFLIVELLTVSFFYLWFGIGAFTAFAFQLMHFGVTVQVTVFTVVSFVLVLLSEKIFKKYLFKKGKRHKTNIYSIVGTTGIVTKDIKPDSYLGKVLVDGRVWTAVSDTFIKKGIKVVVKKVDGVKLEVETEKEYNKKRKKEGSKNA